MQASRGPWSRVYGLYQRKVASLLFKRLFVINSERPLISFTFDDFPRSALLTGGSILNEFGLAATYYVSIGLAGKETASGKMFLPEDLSVVVEEGHELGCHTFAHCHSWRTNPRSFEKSVIENQGALSGILPGTAFKTFSYPISPPRPLTKARVSRHFLCCRGSGQTFNKGATDLNQLAAYFLEQSRDDLSAVKEIIDQNCRARGWLILATHDVTVQPTPYGCTPDFFSEVVQYAVSSGSRILPITKCLGELSTIRSKSVDHS
jgi:peptidoglycan/xylan/chitin deacetylase (PgdA/CDA1 family)